MNEERFNIENNRDESNIGKIYFYKDGNSPWYRAYELSAYYASHYNNGLAENEKLNAQRKRSRLTKEGIMQVGLQLKSFKKYFPNIDVTDIKENAFSIDIDLDDFTNVSLENYKDICVEWKREVCFGKEKSKHTECTEAKTLYSSLVSFSSIMREIIRFDTHNRTEEELRYFIGTLKNMCADLI